MSHNNINRLKLTIPMSPALTPNDIANIITSVEALALNHQQLRADEIELNITGPEGSLTKEDAAALAGVLSYTHALASKARAISTAPPK